MHMTILAGGLLALALGFGSAATAATAEDKAGLPHSDFIKDTARLTEKDARRGDLYLNYTSAAAGARQTKTLYLKPLASFPAGAGFAQVDQATVTEALNYLEQTLRARLAAHVSLAASAAQADTTLEVVLSDITSIEEGRKLRDLVPLRLITNPIKNAAKGKPMQASGTLESRISDTASGEVLLESIQRGAGKSIGRAEDAKTKVDFAALKPLLDAWVVSISEEVKPLKP